MADTKTITTAASRVTLEDFLEVANNSVLRAIQAQKLPSDKPWPFGPIICGIIFNPPEGTTKIPSRAAKE